MSSTRIHRLLLLAALAAAGCQEPPEAAFRALADAARRGDTGEVLARLTQRSRILAQGILDAAPEARPLFAPTTLANDVEVLFVSANDEEARLTVRSADGRERPIVLHDEDGAWRVDLVDSEQAWSRLRLLRETSPRER